MNIHNNYSSSICTKKFYKNVKTLCNIFILKKLSKTVKMPIIHNFHYFLIIGHFVQYIQKAVNRHKNIKILAFVRGKVLDFNIFA